MRNYSSSECKRLRCKAKDQHIAELEKRVEGLERIVFEIAELYEAEVIWIWNDGADEAHCVFCNAKSKYSTEGNHLDSCIYTRSKALQEIMENHHD